SVTYHHPAPETGWYNDWWAKTLSDDNHWGWVPEVYFRGGDNDEADPGLPRCPSAAPAPAPAPKPAPAPNPTPKPAPKPPAPQPTPTPVPAAPAPSPSPCRPVSPAST